MLQEANTIFNLDIIYGVVHFYGYSKLLNVILEIPDARDIVFLGPQAEHVIYPDLIVSPRHQLAVTLVKSPVINWWSTNSILNEISFEIKV